MMLDSTAYAVACLAVVLAGLAKGGFSGLGQLSVPVLALVISPVKAAAILLPILILQDLVGVWTYRRDWDRSVLATMLPGAAAGILAGYLLTAWVTPDAVLGVLGAISILFALYRLRAHYRRAISAGARPHPALGVLLGVASGFTSHVAHAGVPPFQMWVLPRKLPPTTLAGTTAIYFAILNWMKTPAYAALGQFSRENLLAALTLAPVAIVSTVAGVWIVKRLQADRFYVAIYVLMLAVGVQLLWKSLGR